MTTTGRALADSTAIQGFSDEASALESQTGGIYLPLREYFILVIREVAEQFTGKKRGPSGTRQGNLETKLVNETPTQSRKVFRYQCLTICLIFRQNLKTLGTAHDWPLSPILFQQVYPLAWWISLRNPKLFVFD
jgi:hypothetical protein